MAVLEIGGQISSEYDVEVEQDRSYRSSDLFLPAQWPQGTNQSHERISGEHPIFWEFPSSLRGGGSSEEVDEEHDTRYIPHNFFS